MDIVYMKMIAIAGPQKWSLRKIQQGCLSDGEDTNPRSQLTLSYMIVLPLANPSIPLGQILEGFKIAAELGVEKK